MIKFIHTDFDKTISYNHHSILPSSSGVGISGDPQTMFYAEVTDEMKVIYLLIQKINPQIS